MKGLGFKHHGNHHGNHGYHYGNYHDNHRGKFIKLSSCQVVEFDHWDMLNNFCFHVYARKSLFIGENNNAFWLSV